MQKHFNHFIFTFITATVMLTSCGKDGAVGPAGPSGTTGATGATGAVGATGADGTKIYSGTVAPAATLGATGDFYLNVSNSNFYGPKTSSGWGTATSLKGAKGLTGAAGIAGSEIYSGVTQPGSSLGKDGDYYLNSTNYLFYGPKASGAWPPPINLKGAKGDPGTANVIYSDWYTPATYTKTTIFGTINFTADIAASKITQAILDNGAVLVYAKLNGYNPVIWPTDQVSPLPISINYMSGTTPNLDSWSALCTVGNVRISLTSSTNAYGSISNAHQFRYVIIPGGVHTLSFVNLKNYKDVQQVLHLKD